MRKGRGRHFNTSNIQSNCPMKLKASSEPLSQVSNTLLITDFKHYLTCSLSGVASLRKRNYIQSALSASSTFSNSTFSEQHIFLTALSASSTFSQSALSARSTFFSQHFSVLQFSSNPIPFPIKLLQALPRLHYCPLRGTPGSERICELDIFTVDI